jgi:RsiW-degrading membrane proteinase PrsW (M82 family)
MDYIVNYMCGYLQYYFFSTPSAWGIGLAIGFGAVWLAAYWPPIFKKGWLWVILVSSAFFTLAAVIFIQVPLQIWTGQGLAHFWSNEVLTQWILLAAIPQVLLAGLVQEGSKLVPVAVYWWGSAKNLEPKLGLIIGAVAGAGFGILETQGILNSIFASGWTWASVQSSGFMALITAGFWERFFTVAAHIAFSALAGYGLGRGWGWQFYLVAAALHGLLNYGKVLYQAELLSTLYVELYIAVVAVLVTAWALWLRWRRKTAVAEPVGPAEPTEPGEVTEPTEPEISVS